jgi:hypothetical protein
MKKIILIVLPLFLIMISLQLHSERGARRKKNIAPIIGKDKIVVKKPVRKDLSKFKPPKQPEGLPEISPISPSPGNGNDIPCFGVEGGKSVEKGGKCGDGVCENSEYHPAYPPLVLINGKQEYIIGVCEERCAEDCGMLCQNGEQYAWDLSECKLSATPVEAKCKIPFYPFTGQLELSMLYPTIIFMCADDQKYAKINLSTGLWVEGANVVVGFADGSQIKFIPMGSKVIQLMPDGSQNTIDSLSLLFTHPETNDYYICYDLQEFNLNNKELCWKDIMFPGHYNLNESKVIENITFHYLIRFKELAK